MRKMIIAVLACVLLASCEKDITRNDDNGVKVTFSLQGDFATPTFTRSLSANGSDMTDVWVFDFVGSTCVQSVHQVKDDTDFGTPTLTMANGAHKICFVVSRGDNGTVNETNKTIIWDRASDTFFASKDLNVGQGTGSVDVDMSRIATKLKVTVTDKVPEGMAKMAVTPATWYYGVNYYNGEPAGVKNNQAREVSVPANRIGTSGMLNMSIFGISGNEEWKTDVTVTASDDDGDVIGRAEISDAPFVANRQTGYSGRLFSQGGAFAITLSDEWAAEVSKEW